MIKYIKFVVIFWLKLHFYIVMISQQAGWQHCQSSFPKLISTLRFPQSLKIGLEAPTLNNSFFCGYSNGMILQYTYKSLAQDNNIGSQPFPQYNNIFNPYQNCDVIDLDIFSREVLLTCTHTQVTLLNVVKNKRICLRGHEQTPIAVSSHPISPLVVSVSNLVIQHDLRMQKPILVNYITPPVYDIKFMPDGQFYFLSGQPCRIGKDKWMRTLQNGIGTVSKSSKLVLTNDMNTNITLWDWRKSQKLQQIQKVKNQQLYQPIHFLSKQSVNSQVLFLEDDGNLLHHDIIQNRTFRHKLLAPMNQDIWKSQISKQTDKTKHLILYQHNKTDIRCYTLN